MTKMKKRYAQIIGVVIVIAALIALIPMVRAINTYTTSEIMINVSYDKLPVTIISRNLTSSTNPGLAFALYNLTTEYNAMNFSYSTSFLPNGNYKFRVCAHDTDYNIACGTQDFIVNHPSFNITIIEPKVGISTKPVYDILVSSIYDANCRLTGSVSGSASIISSKKNAYATLTPYAFDVTGYTSHAKYNFDASGFDLNKGNYGVVWVVCQLNNSDANLSLESSYDAKQIYVGYDATPPVITVAANPNPVTSPSDLYTDLTVTSDDAVVCRIDHDGDAAIHSWFNGVNDSIFSTYNRTNTIHLDYNGLLLTNQQYALTYTVTCTNLAQLQSTATYTVNYVIANSLAIQSAMSNYTFSQPVSYTITTNMNADSCSINVNGSTTWLPMVSTNKRNFTAAVPLGAGNNIISVQCDSSVPGIMQRHATAQYRMVYDRAPPAASISTSSKTCSLTNITFHLDANDSDSPITRIDYTVTGPGTFAYTESDTSVSSNVISQSVSLPSPSLAPLFTIIPGVSYLVSVNVSSASGRSTVVQKTLTGSVATDAACPVCGDGKQADPEECDYSPTDPNAYYFKAGKNSCTNYLYQDAATKQWLPYVGGILRCNKDCKSVNTSDCNPAKVEYCGDNVTNNFPNEQCDGNPNPAQSNVKFDWGNIPATKDLGCQAFGFAGGTLSCNPPGTLRQCHFNTTQCIGNAQPSTCKLDDNNYGPGEQCTFTETAKSSLLNKLSCNSFNAKFQGVLSCNDPINCEIDISKCTMCGNGIVESGEQCEIGNTTQCTTLSNATITYVNGTASCNADCTWNTASCELPGVCGDGRVNSNEACDYNATTGRVRFRSGQDQCNDYYANAANNQKFVDGVLGCAADCSAVLTSNCVANYTTGFCGNSKIDNYPNEQCDGNTWGSITSCKDLGFDGGTLSCNQPYSTEECMFNTSRCTKNGVPAGGSCGDGYLNPGEQCIPNENFTAYGIFCKSFDSFINGTLNCNANCRIDISGCRRANVCGDGVTDPLEQCDFTGTINCTSIDSTIYNGGTATCHGPGNPQACTYDTSKCTHAAVCGNSILESGEQCEGSNLNSISCASFNGAFTSGNVSCFAANYWDSTKRCLVNTQSCVAPKPVNCTTNTTGNASNATVCKNTPGYCGDHKVDPGEECDGAVSNPAFWKSKMNCPDDVACSGCMVTCAAKGAHCLNSVKDADETGVDCGGHDCTGCAINQFCVVNKDCQSKHCVNATCALDPCLNGVKDVSNGETDTDCGGNNCAPCSTNQTCAKSADCLSNNCLNGICQPRQCENTVQDGNETDVDCGGPSCDACALGKKCSVNTDCASNACTKGTCTVTAPPKTSSSTGTILIIAGVILIIGGAGYVVYRTYIAKPKMSAGAGNTDGASILSPLGPMTSAKQQQALLERRKHEQEQWARIQKRLGEKHAAKEKERSSLLDKLDAESAKPKPDETVKKDAPDAIEFVDMDALTREVKRKDELQKAGAAKPGKGKTNTGSASSGSSGNLFEKLSGINAAGAKDATTHTATTTAGKTSTGSSKVAAGAAGKQDKTALDATKNKDTDPFAKLKNIGQDGSGKDITHKLAELSGKPKGRVDAMLEVASLTKKQTSELFSNMDHKQLTSDVFQEILAGLISTGKLSKESVMHFLFEYMDNGTLTKGDVAKIASALKLV